MLLQVVRSGNRYDYVKDFMLDSLIESKEIVRFKRITGWVTLGVDQIRSSKRNCIDSGSDKRSLV